MTLLERYLSWQNDPEFNQLISFKYIGNPYNNLVFFKSLFDAGRIATLVGETNIPVLVPDYSSFKVVE